MLESMGMTYKRIYMKLDKTSDFVSNLISSIKILHQESIWN